MKIKKALLFMLTFFLTAVLGYIIFIGIATDVGNDNFPTSPFFILVAFFWVFLGIPAALAYYVTFASKKKIILYALAFLVSFVILIEIFFNTFFKLHVEPHTFIGVQPGNLKEMAPPTLSLSAFQNTLKQKCQKIVTSPGSYFIGIKLDDLPVMVNTQIIKIKYSEQETLSCVGSPNKDFITVRLKDNNAFFLYDSYSQELGHGGYPFLGSVGRVIKDEGEVKLSFYLSSSEGPQTVGNIPLIILGQKKIITLNREVVFVNYARTAIPGDDPRLVKLLEKYSKPSEYQPGKKEFARSSNEYQKDIEKTFFTNLSNLQNPEKENIETIEKVLEAVKTK